VNPVIYALRSEAFLTAYRNFLCCKSTQSKRFDRRNTDPTFDSPGKISYRGWFSTTWTLFMTLLLLPFKFFFSWTHSPLSHFQKKFGKKIWKKAILPPLSFSKRNTPPFTIFKKKFKNSKIQKIWKKAILHPLSFSKSNTPPFVFSQKNRFFNRAEITV
jgi:hypothetical protein